MPYAIYWIAALAVCVLGLAISLVWALRRPAYANKGLPAEWSLTAKPVFTTDERRVFRLLREALPHHVVLSKLPLVRFCQPTEAKEVRYWFDLLGASHVTFAVCSPNGRVLAAIDLEGERGVTPRILQIKHAVLSACRVRYLRCAMDQLPSVAELQLLVPQGSNSRGPLPAPATTSLPRRRSGAGGEDEFGSDWGQFSQPLPLWQDAGVFGGSEPFGERHPRMLARPPHEPPQRRGSQRNLDTARYNPRNLPVLDDADDDAMLDDIVGVVVDAPRYATQRPRRS
ncbi:MAG: DUF2726 domain-containing protein [Burkholderiales bacterium]|jgi:hypothetical protein|nr:DUF2726 domain-containing protein [Burkholderiales bacterium]